MNRLRKWMLRAGFSILDQGLTSAASFGLSVLLARTLSPSAYGAFAICFTVFLVISSIHNAILVEPVSVLGPARHAADTVGFLRRAIGVHCVSMALLGAVSVFVSLIFRGQELGPALVAMSCAFPVTLLFWLMRRAHYLETRPALAAVSSAVHLAVLVVLIFLLWRFHALTAATGFLALGGAGLAASVFSMARLGIGVRAVIRSTSELRSTWLELWDFGRWLLPSALFYPLLAQVQLFLTASFLGLASAGVLRALQNPIQPVVQIVTALGTLAIPTLARDFSTVDRETVFRRGLAFAAGVTAVAMSYEVAVLMTGNLWDRLLYSSRYSADEWLMPILGLMPIASSLAGGCSVFLRAIQRPELTTVANIFGGIFGVIASYYLILNYRVAGAVYCLVASQTVTAVVSLLLTFRARRAEPINEPSRSSSA